MEGHICDQKRQKFTEEAAFDLQSECLGSQRERVASPVQMLTWHSVLRDPILNIYVVFLISKIRNKIATKGKELILTFFLNQKMKNVKEETSDPAGLTWPSVAVFALNMSSISLFTSIL